MHRVHLLSALAAADCLIRLEVGRARAPTSACLVRRDKNSMAMRPFRQSQRTVCRAEVRCSDGGSYATRCCALRLHSSIPSPAPPRLCLASSRTSSAARAIKPNETKRFFIFLLIYIPMTATAAAAATAAARERKY